MDFSDNRLRSMHLFWDLPENWCEEDYLKNILDRVEVMLSKLNLTDRFIFIVTSVSDELPLTHSERVVVIQTSDESHEVPCFVDQAFLVFKNYKPFSIEPENLRVIPLGYNKDVPNLKPKQILDRQFDIFFSGQTNYRGVFFKSLSEFKISYPEWKMQVLKAPGFRQGLSPENYSNYLIDSKVALAPRGVSHETFRIYEAMRAGCVVIAERQLPTWFSHGWPIIEVDDWANSGPLISALLSDSENLEAISLRTLRWWSEYCNEDAVARYIVKELTLKLIEGAS
ncbi:MAG: hypothetical protein VX617_06225 [Pseudomonadota bacterium]|nr:hypothetical protein [Pseudomonadota bacterium]